MKIIPSRSKSFGSVGNIIFNTTKMSDIDDKIERESKDKILWQPNPGQQTFALQRKEREILYGGARGGGKTDAAVAWPLRWIHNPLLRFLVVRRNSGDLNDWIDRAKRVWAGTGAEFVAREVRFPSGAVGSFGHLHDDDAYERFQGKEFQKMIIEELTHIPSEELYLKLVSSCRSTVEGLDPQVFNTTNPGNAGHKWVRERWRTPDFEQHNKPFEVGGTTRIFVPAKIEDNPVLVQKDPAYVKWLDSLPEALKRAWRHGSWDTFETKGAYYTKWIEEMRLQGRYTKVAHERSLPVHTWWDLGVGDSTAVGFFQIVGVNEWRMIDYYEGTGEGLQHYVRILEDKRTLLGYTYGEHWAPHDIEVREFTADGLTRRQVAKQLGIDFNIVPKVGIDDGVEALRTRFNTLWIDNERCSGFLDKLSQYRKDYDEKNATFRAKPVHDWTSHAADMMRYWAVTNFDPHTGRQKEAGDDFKPFNPFALTG